MGYLEEYVEFIEKNSLELKSITNTLYNKNLVDLTDLNDMLKKRPNIMLSISLEYLRYCRELKELNRQYKIWFDNKYVLVRKEVNPATLVASKWISKTEIESIVRDTYKEEYSEFQSKIDTTEEKVHFYKNLKELCKDMQADLITLSANERAYATELNVSTRMGSKVPVRG